MSNYNKLRGTAREKADEEKLALLLKEQEEADAPQEPVEQGTFVQEPTPQPEPQKHTAEETWEKRYGDLRRYHQSELDKKEKELKTLRTQIAEGSAYKPPKNKEEVRDWAGKFPDVYGMVRTVAYEEVATEINSLKAQIEELRTGISAKEQEAMQANAFRELMGIHPDFLELRSTASFKEWLAKQSKLIQDALLESWDVSAAAAVIDMYKAKHPNKQPDKAPEMDTRRQAATSIRSGDRPTPGQPEGLWSESRFESLSRRDKEKYMPEIDKAVAEGKFIYDISGAAR